MNLIACLVTLTLSSILIYPPLKNLVFLIEKHRKVERQEKTAMDRERAMELISRAIRMVGYHSFENMNSVQQFFQDSIKNKHESFYEIQKNYAYPESDGLIIRQQISSPADLDCLGNTLTPDRTRQGLTYQHFFIQKKNSNLDVMAVNQGDQGVLICQGLDRQGQVMNAPLLYGVEKIEFKPLFNQSSQMSGIEIKLLMSDGKQYTRHTAFRNKFILR